MKIFELISKCRSLFFSDGTIKLVVNLSEEEMDAIHQYHSKLTREGPLPKADYAVDLTITVKVSGAFLTSFETKPELKPGFSRMTIPRFSGFQLPFQRCTDKQTEAYVDFSLDIAGVDSVQIHPLGTHREIQGSIVYTG